MVNEPLIVANVSEEKYFNPILILKQQYLGPGRRDIEHRGVTNMTERKLPRHLFHY